MALPVTISERAEQNLEAIVTYLSEAWSEQVKMEFLAQLSEKIEHISRMPYMYRASEKKQEIRECVVNKYTLIYYRVKEQEIEIITIQDTRQDPGKLKL